jgi:predicted enzyme related to lactoylglutathione lyase
MHVKFAELPVSDQDRAIAFYSDHLGARVVSNSPYGDDGWRWVELGFDGENTNLFLSRRQDDKPSNAPTMVLIDDDVEGIVARLRDAGVEIITAPREAPWNPGQSFAEFRDSEGNRIVLNSR